MALIRIPAGNYILYKTDYQIQAADWPAFQALDVTVRLEHATDCDGVSCGLVPSPDDASLPHDHAVISATVPGVVPRYLPILIGPE
jgi:hypothetical protein